MKKKGVGCIDSFEPSSINRVLYPTAAFDSWNGVELERFPSFLGVADSWSKRSDEVISSFRCDATSDIFVT